MFVTWNVSDNRMDLFVIKFPQFMVLLNTRFISEFRWLIINSRRVVVIQLCEMWNVYYVTVDSTNLLKNSQSALFLKLL